MSTQKPFTTEPTACSTNWITRFACRLQTLLEPLCEKRSDFSLNTFEQNQVMFDLRATNNIAGFTEQANYTASQWRTLIETDRLCYSEGTAKLLAPRLTLWNNVGLSAWKAFSVGTDCSCCLGWRVFIGSVFLLTTGFLLGAL
jgi:hypothetical protein